MIIRRSLLVIAVTMLFAVGLSACAPGSPMMADHDVDISIEEALAGQDALMSGAMGGEVALTESQASSLLTEVLMQNGLNKIGIAGISSSMDGDVNTISIDLDPAIGGVDSLGVSALVMSEGGVLSVDLDQAWAGGMGLDGAVLDQVSAQINAELAALPLGLPDGPLGLPGDQAAMISDMAMQMGLNSVELSAVKTHFDGGNIGIVGELASAVAGVDSVGLMGALSLDGGHAMVSVSEAHAGNMVADGGLTTAIAEAINESLGAYMFPPASVSADGGSLSISLGQ